MAQIQKKLKEFSIFIFSFFGAKTENEKREFKKNFRETGNENRLKNGTRNEKYRGILVSLPALIKKLYVIRKLMHAATF